MPIIRLTHLLEFKRTKAVATALGTSASFGGGLASRKEG